VSSDDSHLVVPGNDESLQSVTCTGTDNRTTTNKRQKRGKKHNNNTLLIAISLDKPSKQVPESHHSEFYWSKDDGVGGDNWSFKTWKAPVKSAPSANQHLTIYMPNALPVAQTTGTKYWREKVSHSTSLVIDLLGLAARSWINTLNTAANYTENK